MNPDDGRGERGRDAAGWGCAALQIDATQTGDDGLLISGAAPETIGEVAALGGIPLSAMTTTASDLESLFFELTAPPTGADQ